ncbi:beta-D-xylosidase 2-like [Raphidocelis subcapitata]|uniref:Beta-D-xylosidase 2-like n=1 Tax=Raphidocelis subcapitata TaxID=307507 RepID=A0A2V0NPE9_9CHLO|nr:beta-D-xylosidase 2-like [Raphidocelis subcapitata]|eukprot:GBF87380.1 beta-D-xylosidase 2-like [Raphidocelis subcapitata]
MDPSRAVPAAARPDGPAALAARSVSAPAPGSVMQQARMQQQTGAETWRDATLPPAERAADLVGRLTLQEKLTQLHNYQKPLPRLGVPGFEFLNECLHGYWEQSPGSTAPPTIFPQPLAMASTFDRDLVGAAFDAIGTEMRAKSNAELRDTGRYKALTCWTPHMNILRDPRWGRGSETWGEDPHLTSVMAAHVVRGLQGKDRQYVKIAATCKHFFGYSFEMADGVSRFSFDSKLPPQDVTDTYLPAFDACVRAARTQGIMCAYNAVDGTPMCSNKKELRGRLRSKWGFDGYVVSDCNAVSAFVWGHRSAGDDAAAIAQAIKGGTDILCDNMNTEKAATEAVRAGLLSEEDIDAALTATMAVRFRTGQFDQTPWSNLGLSVIGSEEHRVLARAVAQKGIVMLKNEPPKTSGKGSRKASGPKLLPLNKFKLQSICVVGPHAHSNEHMMGNYYGQYDTTSPSPLRAIKAELDGSGVEVRTPAMPLRTLATMYYDWPLESAIEACRTADAAVVFVGASMVATPSPPNSTWRATAWKPVSEGEGIDREDLTVPGRQLDLAKAIAARNPSVPVVLVLMNGGPLDVAWAKDSPNVAAILAAGQPGQEGGRAIADVLFGNVSPSGRLPNTWYHSNYTQAVSMSDMGMRPDAARGYPGRTYRFVDDPSYVQFPFGHGLSYTQFSYSNMTIEPVKASGGRCGGYSDAAFCVGVSVANAGEVEAEEVVMLYLTHVARAGKSGFPLKSLRGFVRTPPLPPGASAFVQLPLGTLDFSVPDEAGANSVRLGAWGVEVGGLTKEVKAARELLDLEVAPVRWPARRPAVTVTMPK